jgi:hypothetical protein
MFEPDALVKWARLGTLCNDSIIRQKLILPLQGGTPMFRPDCVERTNDHTMILVEFIFISNTSKANILSGTPQIPRMDYHVFP